MHGGMVNEGSYFELSDVDIISGGRQVTQENVTLETAASIKVATICLEEKGVKFFAARLVYKLQQLFKNI